MNQADKNIESLFQNLQAEANSVGPADAPITKPCDPRANGVSRGKAENASASQEQLKKPSDFVPRCVNEAPHETTNTDDSASVSAANNARDELITLAESGKIKYTVNYIKKASNVALDKIKADYERKHLEETNDYVANNILSSVTKVLKYFNLVKNTNDLEEDLKSNYLLKRDIKNIVGTITPSIPYIGLMCGGVTVGKHVAMNTLNGGDPQALASQKVEPEKVGSEEGIM